MSALHLLIPFVFYQEGSLGTYTCQPGNTGSPHPDAVLGHLPQESPGLIFFNPCSVKLCSQPESLSLPWLPSGTCLAFPGDKVLIGQEMTLSTGWGRITVVGTLLPPSAVSSLGVGGGIPVFRLLGNSVLGRQGAAGEWTALTEWTPMHISFPTYASSYFYP